MGGEPLRLGRRTAKGVTGYDLTARSSAARARSASPREITLQAAAGARRRRDDARACSRRVRRGRGGQRDHPRRATARARSSCSTARRSTTCARKARVPLPRRRRRDGAPRARRRARRAGGGDGALRRRVRRGAARSTCSSPTTTPSARGCGRRAASARRRCARRTATRVRGHRACRAARSPRCSGASTHRRASGLATATFGHAGDGNLHVNFLTDEDPRAIRRWRARIERRWRELFRATLALGGTLSGEHGIGIAKVRYMAREQSRRGDRVAEAAEAPVGPDRTCSTRARSSHDCRR